MKRSLMLVDTDISDGGCFMMSEGQTITDEIVPKNNIRTMALKVHTITWQMEYDKNDMLIINIYDEDSELVSEKKIPLSECPDNKLTRWFYYDDINLLKGHKYYMEFSAETSKDFALMTVGNENDEPQVCMKIYG